MCFFFKHKTEYELRISAWSSDVCSSDLFVFDRCRRGYERAADKRAGDSGEKCDDSYQQKPATVGHLLAPSSVEGASAGGAPNGARDEARASRPGIAEVARPMASASPAAMPKTAPDSGDPWRR